MAEIGELEIKIKMDDKTIEAITELVGQVNDLCDLIPDWSWSRYEKHKTKLEISNTIGKIMGFK